MRLGVLSLSSKPDERRLPIHPQHFERIDAGLRRRIAVEQGYGAQFGLSDTQLEPLVGPLLPREEILASADIVLLPKPQAADLASLADGQVLWGWPHCVQDAEITQLAIDKRLTLIAFEAMNHWTEDVGFSLHVFHKNNELAGYCSILHALQLSGLTGDYGRRLSAAVIGFGATARGAVTALNAHGISDVEILTNRGVAAVGSPIHSARISQLETNPEDPTRIEVRTDTGPAPLAPFLARHDLVVNCTLQNPNAPLIYVHEDELPLFSSGSLIVDVSCDEGMGFSWARPTSFAEPMFEVGDHVRYYAVDHSPSYLWDSATWEISEALLPFLDTVMSGPAAWTADETVRRAIEIQDGTIVNPAILDFQKRDAQYPHRVLAGRA